MDKIEELKAGIASIEEQAGQLDPTDYEALFKLLIVAFSAAKDVIVLQDGNVPVVTDNTTAIALEKAESTIDVLNLEADAQTQKLEDARKRDFETKKVLVEMQGKMIAILKIVT